MKKILITGGTGFVSGYAAEYYVQKGDLVYVLNRGNKVPPKGTVLIRADRHDLGDRLRGLRFDVILDVTAYTAADVNLLLDAVESYGTYILISSSAVYPEPAPQPFSEEAGLGVNRFWGEYGTGKIGAEAALQARDPNAYILRPPYLYGPMNDLYRESFVFECAMNERAFYLSRNGEMKLQFFHIHDLCRFLDVILEKKPSWHIFNVGNKETVSVLEWVALCYQIVGEKLEIIRVFDEINQRNYFPFYDYEYFLDVREQEKLMPKTKSLAEGLRESLVWLLGHSGQVKKKPLMDYIDRCL